MQEIYPNTHSFRSIWIDHLNSAQVVQNNLNRAERDSGLITGVSSPAAFWPNRLKRERKSECLPWPLSKPLWARFSHPSFSTVEKAAFFAVSKDFSSWTQWLYSLLPNWMHRQMNKSLGNDSIFWTLGTATDTARSTSTKKIAAKRGFPSRSDLNK